MFFARLALMLLASLVASPVLAQAPTPDDHPGHALAQAIAARGCVLHQDDVAALLDDAGLQSSDFPQMALPLIGDGILASTGNGTLTLVAWGLCVGDVQPSGDQADSGGAEAVQSAIATD